MNIIMIDNYDSFTYNLVQEMGKLGAEMTVFRNDKISLDELEAEKSTSCVPKTLRKMCSLTSAKQLIAEEDLGPLMDKIKMAVLRFGKFVLIEVMQEVNENPSEAVVEADKFIIDAMKKHNMLVLTR